MATPSLLDEQVKEAVRLYYLEDSPQEHLAERYQVSQQTISYCKLKDERWEAARLELVEGLKNKGFPAAWHCLVRQAKAGDVQAAKEILNRIEGMQEQTTKVEIVKVVYGSDGDRRADGDD